MSLQEQLWRQFGGDVSPGDLQALAQAAIREYGSGRAAGRALGVDEAQIRRWRDGKTRSSRNAERVAGVIRAHRAESKAGPVSVKFRYAGRDRNLQFGPGAVQGLTPGTIDSVKAAYADGDPDRMARAFIDGVQNPWYHDQFDDAYEAQHGQMADGNAGEGSDSVGRF